MISILFALGFVAMVRAQPYHPGHYGVVPYYRHGHHVDEAPKPYQFSYHAEAIGGSSSRQETGDGSGSVVGSYTLNDVDGRNRLVEYVADEGGFRASVKTNEPGTKNESPADVAMYSTAPDVSDVHVGPASYRAPHHRHFYGSQPYGGHHAGYYGRYGHGMYPHGYYGYAGHP